MSFTIPPFVTFHPKIYLFKSAVAADIVVGSGNLTGGGLFANYEAAIRLRLNLTVPNDAAILMDVEKVLDRWSDQSGGTARLLDEQLLANLAAWGLIPPELLVASSPPGEQDSVGGLTAERDEFPFTARSEPGPPRLSTHRQHTLETGSSGQPLAIRGPLHRFRDDPSANRRRRGTDDIGNFKTFT